MSRQTDERFVALTPTILSIITLGIVPLIKLIIRARRQRRMNNRKEEKS